MSERQDFIALEWVAGEIEETLKQAAQALGEYTANRDDSPKLRFCLTHIHQVHGTLLMVEFFGAALLAEEMEGLAHALMQGKIHSSHIDDALSVLKKAITQLPLYLDKVKESRHGLPATLLPVLNDLRAVRGESLLSETVLFAPDMKAAITANEAAQVVVATAELHEVANKLRQMFQVALLGLIRGNDVSKNLNYLAKVCARLVKLTEGYPLQPLWKVCIAVLEGLLNGSIDSSVAVKILLRQVDRQIKHIIDSGSMAFHQPPPDNLLKNLLYYVACSKSNSRYISEIKNEYSLAVSLLGEGELDDESLATPDGAVMQAVIAALGQELAAIKTVLVERSSDSAALTDVLQLFKRVNDTMAILGMGAALKQLQIPYSDLAKALATQEFVSSEQVNNIVLQVAAVESELHPEEFLSQAQERSLFNDSEEAQQQLDSAYSSVVRESRKSLELAKEAIIEFVATQWNHECLVELPNLLMEISGSLNIVSLPRAAQVLSACRQYVSQKLLAERAIPEWQMLDTLADAITSVDYYLERLDDGAALEGDTILTVAEESVAELGYPVARQDEAGVTESSNELEAPELEVDPPMMSAEEPLAPVLAEVIPFRAPSQTVVNVAEIEAEIDDDFDPEIVEIFVEEAGEVLTEINESLPLWQADANNTEAAANVRRAFHTLKGSGRMVKALAIGELAWSIEDMLNRVLEGSLTIDAARFALIEETKALVPAMVTAFEQRQAIDKTAMNSIIARANLLAKEQSPLFENSNHELESVIGSELAEPETTEQFESESVAVDSIDTAALDVEPPIVHDELAEEIDTELLEIFAAETAIHVQVLDDFIGHCYNLAGPAELTDALQRALHTLKGSANMAGVTPVVMVVTPLEHVIKELRASQLKVDEPLVALLERGSLMIKAGIEQLATTPMQVLPSSASFIEELLALLDARLITAATAAVDSEDAGIPPEALNNFLTESLDLITELSGRLVLWQQGDVQPEELNQFELLMDKFIGHAESVNIIPAVEFGQLVQVLYRQAIQANSAAVTNDFFVLMNEGNDCLVDMLDQIAGHQTPVYDDGLFNRMQEFVFEVIADETEVIADPVVLHASEMLQNADFIEGIAEDDSLFAEAEVFELDLNATIGMTVVPAENVAEFDAELPVTNDEEVTASEYEQDEATLETFAVEQDVEDLLDELKFDELDDPDQEAHALELVADVEMPLAPAIDPVEFEFFESDELTGLVAESSLDNIQAVHDEDDAVAIVAAMSDLAAAISAAVDLPGATESNLELEPEQVLEPEPEFVLEPEQLLEPEPELVLEPEPEIQLTSLTRATEVDDDEIDEEIVEIFLEEAEELLEGIDEAIQGWSDNRSSREYLDDLLRILHTFKGGARLAGITAMGDLSHNFETSLIEMDGFNGEVDEDTLQSIQDYQDLLLAQLAAYKAGETLADVAPLGSDVSSTHDAIEIEPVPIEDIYAEIHEVPTVEEALTIATEEAAPLEAINEDIEEVFDFDDLDFAAVDADLDDIEVSAVADLEGAPIAASPSIDQMKDTLPAVTQKLRAVSPERALSASIDSSSRKGSQEVVKVSAQLLEELVNLAGETSISRSRAEEQISELVFSLDEMQITVDRLQEQVRRLDMETEQQLLYRQEQVESEGLEGFDPLEMDRYSQLQQLSRSLMESSSDLIDIKSTLSDKSRDMETLLVQQSRINTELQEGLMRSQMVPFSRMVPRLRRIVRQVSGELDKRVDFHLENVEGELDRAVLERMVAPLEHMLRNAVDHGIESADLREAAGKNRRGNITLDLAREGGEIVFRLVDDGAGIDLAAVRAKAVERGLMEAHADLSDHEISRFILQSGFSTAAKITQISGRGVGMDVVHSEIKQLGGSMDIESTVGKGTRFTVRLPFTVSVNRALMVNVGGDRYAIPLNSIEGIVRVSPFELEAYYQPDAPMFEYAGQAYLLRYMGALLQRGDKPNLEGQIMPLPVVLVRGAEHSIAIQVDSLLGSREIVVKPLGPQFSMVHGLSGATVLGDGSVVVILDLLALIRADASFMYKDMISAQHEALVDKRSTLVMVVDDSVTVRKVTSRFLERQGMEVITAKDGMDAVTQLQEIERIPDLMLLDIEMPRMDGFEVANRVRHNSRLQDIPIIMITSRTGEKHRERAFSLGVNEYMGKPFQEAELLEKIQTLIGVSAEK